jgi:hypothetical protein
MGVDVVKIQYRTITNGKTFKIQQKYGFFGKWVDRFDHEKYKADRRRQKIPTPEHTSLELAEMFMASVSSKDEWVVMSGPHKRRKTDIKPVVVDNKNLMAITWAVGIVSLIGLGIVYFNYAY